MVGSGAMLSKTRRLVSLAAHPEADLVRLGESHDDRRLGRHPLSGLARPDDGPPFHGRSTYGVGTGGRPWRGSDVR